MCFYVPVNWKHILETGTPVLSHLVTWSNVKFQMQCCLLHSPGVHESTSLQTICFLCHAIEDILSVVKCSCAGKLMIITEHLTAETRDMLLNIVRTWTRDTVMVGNHSTNTGVEDTVVRQVNVVGQCQGPGNTSWTMKSLNHENDDHNHLH